MDEKARNALTAARMYYLQDLTMGEIAKHLRVSRSKVSRLIAWARTHGLVEIRVNDLERDTTELEAQLNATFGIRSVVVATPRLTEGRSVLSDVARVAAGYVEQNVRDGVRLALAWGTTVKALGEHLHPKPLRDVIVVQLNGSGNTHDVGVSYSIEILRRFAAAFDGRIEPFPVPTFFDYPETKQHLWREQSIRRILDLQRDADLLLYSIGAFESGVPSHVYTGGYLKEADLEELEAEGVVGDIATVFYRADGTWRDIPINARASGPSLELFADARDSICVVAGETKARGLLGALRGGYVKRLVTDAATARRVLELVGRVADRTHGSGAT